MTRPCWGLMLSSGTLPNETPRKHGKRLTRRDAGRVNEFGRVRHGLIASSRSISKMLAPSASV